MVADRFAEEPLASDAVVRHLHPGFSRGSGRCWADPVLRTPRPTQETASALPHRSDAFAGTQWMVSRLGGVQVQHGRKLRLGLRGSTHSGETLPDHDCSQFRGTFSTTC